MNLVDRAKNIILTPKTEWPAIAAEEPNIGQIMTGYVLPLALIPAVANIIGWGIIGRGFVSFTYGIASGVVSFGVAVLSVFLVAYVVDFLAPNFSSTKNIGRAFQLVAYSYTPSWIAGVLLIVPVLSPLAMLAGLYGIYLMYLGLPFTMKTPPDKSPVYLIVIILALILVYAIVGAILGAITFGLFGVSALTGVF
ncbi:MAG: DUF1282 family protein [Ignavibacteriae bacterium]|nr:DUF1282 family protein [Ignavibacteriota bacterium]